VTLVGPWVVGRPVTRDAGGGIVFPPPTGGVGQGPYVYDANSARRVPAVARALQLYSGMMKQMGMDAYRGADKLPRPKLLEAPDPFRGGPWFVHNSVEDYLLNGNAISVVTARGADGWPLAVRWLPAGWVYIVADVYAADSDVAYYYLGRPLPAADVVHVRRGADRFYPSRGVGVVEEFLSTLDRVAMEEAYESATLSAAAVPSVAIITPNATLNQDTADEAKAHWQTNYGGANRVPAILPNGTQVIPLSWSPTDTQLIEARRLSLVDVANAFNLDGYWLSAPGHALTYKTAAPQYQQILRTSIEPVLVDFESIWSAGWLPRGQTVVFDRKKLLRDDLPTTMTAAVQGKAAGIITTEEARDMLGLPAEPELGVLEPPTAPPALGAAPPAADDQTEEPPP
jgi:HK97 family phage portal protein